MKKFLITLSAGLFAISLFLAPVATFAINHEGISPSTTCTTRSDVGKNALQKLTGTNTLLDKVPSGTPLPNTTLYSGPDAGINASFGIICVYSYVEWITNLAFLIIGAISVLIIIYAAFLYLTAGANPDNTKKAKDFILYAVVGIAVAIFARVIPTIVINFLG